MWYQSLLSVLKSVGRYRSIVQALLKFNTHWYDKASNVSAGNRMTTPLLSALTLAKHVVARMEARGHTVNNLKLQKLLYYTQAWHLALHGEPVFYEQIEAWVKGPVVPAVFQQHKHLGYMSIRNTPAMELGTLSPGVSAHLDEVLDAYAQYSGFDLSTMTHMEDPWSDARKGLSDNDPSRRVITHESMRRYYANAVNGQEA
jgi:uncharacterized phage-associated protein